MVEINKSTGETHVFCDRCSKEIFNTLILMNSGDVLCEECFEKEHKIMTVDEYLKTV